MSKGFISPNLKLRRYGVWVVKVIRTYMKKKGFYSLDYTHQEWRYVWRLQPLIPEPEPRFPKPKSK